MAKSKRSDKLPPIHPGEILREDHMKPWGLTAHRLAMALHVPATRIVEIVHERRAITADTAIGLGRYFKTTLLAPFAPSSSLIAAKSSPFNGLPWLPSPSFG